MRGGSLLEDVYDKTEIYFILNGELDWDVVSDVICGHRLSLQVPPRNSFGIFVNDDEDADDLLSKLQADPRVQTAYFKSKEVPDAYVSAVASNDVLAPFAWQIVDLDLYRAHRLQRGQPHVWHSPEGPYMPNHEEFRDNLDTCFVYPNVGVHPGSLMNDHGNLISSMCHADSKNGAGIVGVAPKVMLVHRGGTAEMINAAIGDMMGLGVRTIFCVSATLLADDQVLRQAIDDHHAAGGLYFKSAGNTGALIGATDNPRTLNAIRVAAACPISLYFPTRFYSTEVSTFSSWSPTRVHLVAPGQMVLGAINNTASNYLYNDGTSFAGPIASAVAALVLSENAELTSDQVVALIQSTCNPSLQSTVRAHCASEGTPNAYKAVLKARSLRADRAGEIFPYIYFLGAFKGNEAHTYIDPATKKQHTNLCGKVLVELGVYGQAWTDNGTVEFYAGEELLYSGPPTKIVQNTTIVPIDSITSATDYTTRVSGNGYSVSTLTGNERITTTQPGPGLYSFSMNLDFTGAAAVTFEVLLTSSSVSTPLSGFLELFINGEFVDEIISFHDDIKPRNWERLAVDAERFTGVCEVKFQTTLHAGNFGQISFRNFITSADHPTTSAFVWDVAPLENRELRMVATDGGLTETTFFEVDLTPPHLSINAPDPFVSLFGTITGEKSEDAEVVGVGGAEFGQPVYPTGTTWEMQVSGLSAGENTVIVEATNEIESTIKQIQILVELLVSKAHKMVSGLPGGKLKTTAGSHGGDTKMPFGVTN
jgi:hypothetical protein